MYQIFDTICESLRDKTEQGVKGKYIDLKAYIRRANGLKYRAKELEKTHQCNKIHLYIF